MQNEGRIEIIPRASKNDGEEDSKMRIENDGEEHEAMKMMAIPRNEPSLTQFHSATGNQYVRKTMAR